MTTNIDCYSAGRDRLSSTAQMERVSVITNQLYQFSVSSLNTPMQTILIEIGDWRRFSVLRAIANRLVRRS